MSMYIPSYFNENNESHIAEIITSNPFADVIVSNHGISTRDPSIPLINHIPLIYDPVRKVLRGHIALANAIARLDRNISHNAFIVFHGPSTYVSPSWYPSKEEDDGKVVPTWNYIAIHIQGKLQLISDKEWIYNLVSELTSIHESTHGSRWKVTDAPPDYIQEELRGIVGVEIAIENIEAKFKLSQNRSLEDRNGVISNLEQSNNQNERKVGEWMKKILPK
jgi:transcriptional regulator